MLIKLLQTSSVVALEGSIIEVTEEQYKALGSLCILMDDKKVEKPEKETVKKEEPIKKSTTRAKAKK